jgi:hypothetical protein
LYLCRFHPITCHEGTEGGVEVLLYSFLNFGARSDGWLAPRPAALRTPGNENRYPLYWRLGGPQSRSGWVRKIVLTGFGCTSDIPCYTLTLCSKLYHICKNQEQGNNALCMKVLDKVSGQLRAPAALQRKKSIGNRLNRTVDVPQRRSGRFEEKNLCPLPGNEIRILDRPTHYLVTTAYCPGSSNDQVAGLYYLT